MKQHCTIIDYGMGNLHSVVGALKYLDVSHSIASSYKDVKKADSLILPGVGSFARAMTTLNQTGFSETIREAVLHNKKKILGICLGQQLMAEQSTEDGLNSGLSLYQGRVERFKQNLSTSKKVPHIGFNKVQFPPNSRLFRGFKTATDFYFVHSYRVDLRTRPGISAITEYGDLFLAAYENENIYATQFHPEKSQTNGLKLLRNFLKAE